MRFSRSSFRLYQIFLPILMLSFAINSVYAFQETKSPFVLVERGEKSVEYRLPNGLKVLLLPDQSTPVATLMVVYHVGSRNEAVGHTGSTHILEHMMFKGTPTFNKEKGTQIATVLESLGADYNATTWFDRTNYYETLPADKLETALKLEADRMRNAFIKDSDRQSEMTVVRNELELGENDPSTVLDSQVYATVFREHPYHHPTIGWRSDVEGVPTARLKQFYDTFYWPNNATLMIVGDFEETTALNMIEKYFAPLSPSPSPIPPIYTVEPPQQGERRFVLRRAGELPIVEMAWPVCNGKNEDIYALLLLETILAKGVNSRLYQALVEKNLAVNVLAHTERLHDPGIFQIVATVQSEAKPNAVEEIIQKELTSLQKDLVSEKELARAKKLVNADFAYRIDSSAGLAAEIAEAISNGDWHLTLNFTKNVEAVTAERIQAVIKRYLTINNQTVGYFEPITEPKTETSDQTLNTTPNTKATLPALQQAANFHKRPTGELKDPSLIAGQADKKIVPFAQRIKRVQFDNGSVLLMLPRQTVPTVAIQGSLLVGDYLDPKERPMLAYITQEMLDKGTEHYSKTALAAELENMGAQFDFSTDAFRLSIDGRCLAKDVDKSISLLAEILRRPKFSQLELDKIKLQTVASLKEALVDTSQRAYDRATQIIFDPSHPYYELPLSERIKSVESITLKDVEGFYKKYYGGATLILSLAGDIDPKAVEESTRTNFGNWAGGKNRRPEVATTTLQKEKKREDVPVKDKASADILIAQSHPLRRNSPEFYAAQLANNALGESTLSSRLGLQVRDTEGLTYGITSHFFGMDIIDGFWGISLSVNPENIDKAINSSLAVFQQYVKEGISEKELADRKGAAIGLFKVQLSSNSGIAARLNNMEFFQLGLDYIDRYPQIIEAITKTDIDKVIKDYFHPEKITIIVAGEVGKKEEADKK